MEKYLRKCLESLIISDESMEKLEVLIINDGSKDSSSQIAHEYESKYPRTFRVIDKENGNYGSCINRGLKEVIGKYVKILDADDYFNTDLLEDFLFFTENVDVDLILSDFVKVDINGTVLSEYNQSQLFGLKSGTILDFPSFCHANPSFYGYMHSFAYRTDLFNRFSYFQTEGISYTDQEWVFIPVFCVKTFSYLEIPIYNYLTGREGQTMDTTVLGRSMTQLVLIARRLSVIYTERKKANCGTYDYFENHISTLLTMIYKQGLIQDKSHSLTDVLKEFDTDICCLTDINSLSESISFGRVKYVKLWRSNNRNQLPLWFLIYVKILNYIK